MYRSLPLIALLVAGVSTPPIHASERNGPFLTVTGRAQVRVEPDEARIRLGITEQAPRASQAQEQVNRVASAILQALETAGVSREEIQTSDLSLFPVFSRQPSRVEGEEPRIVGYRASNMVTVRVRDLDRIGPVVDAGLQAGANQLHGIEFGLADDLPSRRDALRLAVQEARQKAQVVAEAMGMTLGPPVEVQEAGVTMDRPVPSTAYRTAVAEAATPVTPGQVSVEARVEVRYRLAP